MFFTSSAYLAVFQELHGNCTKTKSRSTAGSICQTRGPNLVVSHVGAETLLPSVVTFRQPTLISAVSAVTDHFRVLS